MTGWEGMRRADFDHASPYTLHPELDPLTTHTRWAPDLPPAPPQVAGQDDLFGMPAPAPTAKHAPKRAALPEQGALFGEGE